VRLVVILTAALSALFWSDTVPAGPADELVNRKIDAIFSPLAAANSPGFSVVIRQGQQTIFVRGYGVREFGKPARIDPQTNFRLASCSKQFTAMAIMLLVHDGKLRYEETLPEIFPDFPEYGKSITIRNLLNHTSGLRDYETLMDEQATDPGFRGLCFAETGEYDGIHAGNKVGLQQFGIRFAGIGCRTGCGKIIWRFSREANLRSAENEPYPGI